MQPIEAILFDPVGALAEFPSDEFDAIASQVLGRGPVAHESGSEAYWGILNLLDARGLAAGALPPERTMFLADTAAGLQAAKQAGVNGILMMNDPDEAMKLTACDPAGGIVSLHELPDFVRVVAAENGLLGARTSRF